MTRMRAVRRQWETVVDPMTVATRDEEGGQCRGISLERRKKGDGGGGRGRPGGEARRRRGCSTGDYGGWRQLGRWGWNELGF